MIPPYCGATPPPRLLVVHSVLDSVVPLHQSLTWARGPHSSGGAHVIAVLNDDHPLRTTCTAARLREWLQALTRTAPAPTVGGGASSGTHANAAQWAHALPSTLVVQEAQTKQSAEPIGRTAPAPPSSQWAQRFQDAAES